MIVWCFIAEVGGIKGVGQIDIGNGQETGIVGLCDCSGSGGVLRVRVGRVCQDLKQPVEVLREIP